MLDVGKSATERAPYLIRPVSGWQYAFRHDQPSCGTSAAVDLQTHPFRSLINGVRIP